MVDPDFARKRDRTHGWRLGVVAWITLFLLPLAVSSVVLTVDGGLPWPARAAVFATGAGFTVGIGWYVGGRMLYTLGTVFDLLGALREGDYGLRGRVPSGRDPLWPLVADVNRLSDELRSGRRERTESSRFLGKTLAVLRDPVFVVDDANRMLLINAAGRRLIGAEGHAVIGRDLAALGLAEALAAGDETILDWHFAAASGRWAVRRSTWYSAGREHTLVMLHDLSATLGATERHAWQRLIRVLSHELNNSLAPIGSMAESLSSLLRTEGALVRDELEQGLEVISRRSSSLARFLSGYGELARLPPPRMQPFRLDLLLDRLARLERRLPIVMAGDEPLTILGDEDQLGQAFLNLMRNAVEAALPTGGGVRVAWCREGESARVTIEDGGAGLPSSGALFVPFFTTKPGGSGIGLSLARLIVEAHAGSVYLEDRRDAPGAVATVRLPVGA